MKFLIMMLLIISLGCQQQEAPVESNLSMNNEESFLLKPPEYSGPYVVRTEYPLMGDWVLFTDTKTNMTAIFGVELFNACTGQGVELDILPVIDIFPPEDPNRIIEVQKGVVHAYVFEGIYPGGGVCSWISGNPALAWGMADIVLTDNDLLSFLNPDSKNVNAFGFSIHGKLTTSDGGTAIFTGMSRTVWDGVDGTKLFKSVSKITLN